jgi:1-deoxy-D-xylulose-5-phosphate synthase
VVKPLDPAMIADAATHPVVVTIEDGLREGGVGSAIADAISVRSTSGEVEGAAPPVRVLGTPVAYLPHGKPDEILAELDLDAEGVAAEATRLVGM